MDEIKKVAVVALLAFFAFPFVVKYWPKPPSFERAREAFEKAGWTVEDYTPDASLNLGAESSVLMRVNGVRVEIYHFTDEGKIATQLEYQKKDVGTAIVETWNLAESLGAAKPANLPSQAARNGMFMIVATGENKDALHEVVKVFQGL